MVTSISDYYFIFFSTAPKTSTPSSVLNQAAKAEYGFSSNGTLNSFLPLPHVNCLPSGDSCIMFASTALIPTFLK